MDILNFKTVKQKDQVIVIGGGPSVTSNMNGIRKFIHKFDPIVITANYNFGGIKSHYTYCTDIDIYRAQARYIRSDFMVVPAWFAYKYRKIMKKNMRFKFMVIGIENGLNIYHLIRNRGPIQIDKRGNFPYFYFGTAGYGALTIASLFNPKLLLMVGFNGPTEDMTQKQRFDGKFVEYHRSPHKTNNRKKYLHGILLPWLKSRNIQIMSFKDDRIWGLNKEKFGITNYE